MTDRKQDFSELQLRLGYRFRSECLLAEAFVHRSFLNECTDRSVESNERLEFLGDAVLELIISDLLYHRYPSLPEGDLTRKRSQAVCEASFATLANYFSLGDYLLLSKGEDASGGRHRPSILADCFEALCGAIYLDGGYRFLVTLFENKLEQFLSMELEQQTLFVDYKSRLQELLHHRGKKFSYHLISESGPDHAKQFVIGLYIDGREYSRATGKNKKKAQQEAARLGYERLKGE